MGVLAVLGLKLGKGGTRRLNRKLPTSGTPVTGVLAAGTLGMATKPTVDDDTVTIGTTVYTFVTTPAAAGDVAVGALVANSQENLVAAIAGDSFNTAHPDVVAADFGSDEMVITAKRSGVAANAIATEETFTDGTDAWVAALMSGGVDAVGDDADLGDQLIDDTNLYFCTTAKVPTTGGVSETPAVYKKIAMSSL